MSARADKPISVKLRDGILALDREDATFESILKNKVEEALADGRPDIGADAISLGLRSRHHERLKRDK